MEKSSSSQIKPSLYKNDNMFEKILNNPGLQHLAEIIFGNLEVEHFKICRLLNQSAKRILDGPMFQDPMYWLKKFRGLSIGNQYDWAKAIQSVQNSFERKYAIISYLQWNLQKEVMDDLPCYTNSAIQDDFRMKIGQVFCKRDSSDEDVQVLKMLAPLTDKPNAPDKSGYTPIQWAAKNGHTEIVKILAPLTDNPNAPDKSGYTPIQWAAKNGHTELVKILTPLTNNPNSPNDYKRTPIHSAAQNGHVEIIKILIPLTDNTNAQDRIGYTPIHLAAMNGHTEIVKILAPLSDNPNAKDFLGRNPIYEAACNGHLEIVKILAPLTNNPNAPDKYGKTPSSVARNAEIRNFLILSFGISKNHSGGQSN